MSSHEMDSEPRLSADFATQVLRRVDGIRARRRMAWRAGGAAVVLALVAAAVALRMTAVQPVNPVPKQDVVPVETASVQTESPAASAKTQTLDYMFPDAMPLARFSDIYGGATQTNSTDALFAREVPNDDSL